MMSWPALWSWVIGITVLAWALIRKKKWFAVFPMPFALIFALGSIDTWRAPYIGPAVIHELGYFYLMLGFVPLISIIVLLCVVKKRANQALQHNDPSCHVPCLRTYRASRGRG